jgi:hypothetical protein
VNPAVTSTSGLPAADPSAGVGEALPAPEAAETTYSPGPPPTGTPAGQ